VPVLSTLKGWIILSEAPVAAPKRRKSKNTYLPTPPRDHSWSSAVPPAAVLAERDTALAEPLTLSRELMGDPPPSRSALHRQVAAKRGRDVPSPDFVRLKAARAGWLARQGRA
jgi:hypothetical protein